MTDIEKNHCCYCGDECNPCSQACGRCMRRNVFMDPKDITYYTPSPSLEKEEEHENIIIEEIIENMKKLTENQRLEIISHFCSHCMIEYTSHTNISNS